MTDKHKEEVGCHLINFINENRERSNKSQLSAFGFNEAQINEIINDVGHEFLWGAINKILLEKIKDIKDDDKIGLHSVEEHK